MRTPRVGRAVFGALLAGMLAAPLLAQQMVSSVLHSLNATTAALT